jgi:uncharacterized protein YxjI
MRYLMKQNWFSFGDDYTVRDANGNDLFQIDGKVFTLRKTFVIEDMQGRELAVIEKKILAWGPTYEIYRNGAVAAVVKKSLFTLFHCEFTVDVPGPDDLKAEGSFWEYEYSFSRHDRVVASVSKKFFSWTDTYGIDVARGEDDVLVIASAVVIDQCCHEEK